MEDKAPLQDQIRKAALTYAAIENMLKHATSPITVQDAINNDKVKASMTNRQQVQDCFRGLCRRGVARKLDYHGVQNTKQCFEYVQPEHQRGARVREPKRVRPPKVTLDTGPRKPSVRITKNAVYIEYDTVKVTVEF